MSNIPRSGILVDLDSLFDTRITTLIKINPDVAEIVLAGGYNIRPIESFPNVPYSVFKKHYDNRDKHTLLGSPPTPMIEYIRTYVGSTVYESMNGPHTQIPKIMVNLYPYTFKDEEISLLVKGIVASTNGVADVECINLPIEKITPSWLRDNEISLFVYYEYYEWFEIHAKSGILEKESCPEIGMLGPKIVFEDTLPSEEEMEKAFKEMIAIAAPFIQLELVSVSLFSVPVSLEKKK